MIVITRTYKTLSPRGGCRNFINHRLVKCFNDDDLEGVENFMKVSESKLREQECGYDIYNLHYDLKKL